MKYVLDENGNIKVGKGGHPMVTGDDGKEFEIDAIGANMKIVQLSAEAKDHRKKAAEYKSQLDAFEGIEDPKAALDALATVANLDANMKGEIAKVKEGLEKSYTTVIGGKDTEIATLKAQLFDTNVLSKFATSDVIKKTTLPPDIAATYFKKHFKEDGTAIDKDGNVIYSKEKPGTPAGFDEAMTSIIDSYPGKESILRGTGMTGTGFKPPAGNTSGELRSTSSSVDLIKAGLAARGMVK